MAQIVAYSHNTTLSIPAEAWDEAWFTLMSWKGYLQSFPGFLELRLAGRALDNGDVRLHTATLWDYPEQLEAWRESDFSVRKLLQGLRRPVYDVEEETLEAFA